MKTFTYTYTKHLQNINNDVAAYPQFSQLLKQTDCEAAQKEISQWKDYKATDLISLDDVAATAGVDTIQYKDESTRFGLGSFKALGGAYAVFKLANDYKNEHGNLNGFAVATATDGNHGRSVAWGAKRLGLESHIFIHSQLSQQRSDAMTALGAVVHRCEGNYDDSLVECERMAKENSWQIVSDTSWEGYETVPVQIMAGYSMMAEEIVQQLDGKIPSHFFIPAGCGGLAGGMLAYFWQVWKEKLPTIVIVESKLSDCVYQSIQNQEIKLVHITEETVMAGLSCGEVSRLIWPILSKGVNHVITIPDDGIVPMMRWLANPIEAQRPSIEGGECSAASLAALLAATSDPVLKEKLGLNEESSVLVLGTEGATDPEFYYQAVNGEHVS